MKKPNKWILGAAGAVLVATISYKIIAQQTVKPMASTTGPTFKVTTNNQTSSVLKIQGKILPNIGWPNDIQQNSKKTSTVTIKKGSSAGVLYGYKNGNMKVKMCDYMFENFDGIVRITSVTAYGVTCASRSDTSSVTLTVTS